MSEVEDLLAHALDRIAALESRSERGFRYGKVIDASDVDLSDPTNPVARIHVDDDEDGQPVKGAKIRFATWAGDRVQHTPPTANQQFAMMAPDGEHEAALLLPLGHSTLVPSPSTDPNVHIDQYGQTKTSIRKDSHTRTVGGTQVVQDTKNHKVTAPGQIVHAAGDPSAANSSGAGSLTNFPHELNRIIQGFAGRLDQHDHHHTAMHDQVSTMVDKLVGLCPALLDQQQNTLNHKAEGLQKAADQSVGMLPSYSASAIQQTLAKLLGGTPLGSVTEIAQGDIVGQMTGLLGQIGSMVGGAGFSGAAAAAASTYINQAQLAVAAAASGGNADLDTNLTALTSLASGSPVAGMLGDIVGQLRSVMGSTSGLLSGLSGLLDGQVNATKGTIKSAMFGKY